MRRSGSIALLAVLAIAAAPADARPSLPTGGEVTFPNRDRKVVGASVFEIRNQAHNAAIGAAGVMRCKYPRS